MVIHVLNVFMCSCVKCVHVFMLCSCVHVFMLNVHVFMCSFKAIGNWAINPLYKTYKFNPRSRGLILEVGVGLDLVGISYYFGE